MKNKVICDSGVISRYLLNEKPMITTINDKIGIENVVITPLNKIELLNWLSGYHNLDKPKRAKFLRAIKDFPIIHINEPISRLAITLSDKHINSKPADTFIASISIYHKVPIYTLNTKDFKILKAILF